MFSRCPAVVSKSQMEDVRAASVSCNVVVETRGYARGKDGFGGFCRLGLQPVRSGRVYPWKAGRRSERKQTRRCVSVEHRRRGRFVLSLYLFNRRMKLTRETASE